MRAPAYPSTLAVRETQPKLLTKAGTASGATSSTFQTRRPGNSVRSTSQAIPVPITNVSPTQPATSKPVFLRSSPTRGRQVRATASSHPIVRT